MSSRYMPKIAPALFRFEFAACSWWGKTKREKNCDFRDEVKFECSTDETPTPIPTGPKSNTETKNALVLGKWRPVSSFEQVLLYLFDSMSSVSIPDAKPYSCH